MARKIINFPCSYSNAVIGLVGKSTWGKSGKTPYFKFAAADRYTHGHSHTTVVYHLLLYLSSIIKHQTAGDTTIPV